MEMTYFISLPQELHNLLLLYFSPNELLSILPYRKSMNINVGDIFWKTVWRRDISSFLTFPDDIPSSYRDIIGKYDDVEVNREHAVDLAKHGYDMLLYELLKFNRCEDGRLINDKLCDVITPIYLLDDLYSDALYEATYSNHVVIVKYIVDLLKKKTNKYINYASLLCCAACNNSLDVIGYLMEYEHFESHHYEYAIRDAASFGNLETIKKLINFGDGNHDVALSHAAYRGHKAIVEFLLDQNIGNYQYAMAACKAKGHTEILDMIMKKILQ